MASIPPFHFAVPVHNLDLAKKFYGEILGCVEGRSSAKWQDYNFFGHQLVCHWVGDDYRGTDYYNPVDGDEVPVAHFGAVLDADSFHTLAAKLQAAKTHFIIQPHLRFKGQAGEQWTMFFKDPSGNNLEFKSMANPGNLFAKYNVDTASAPDSSTEAADGCGSTSAADAAAGASNQAEIPTDSTAQ